MSISEAEKTFILHGVKKDFRVDGRRRNQYRPMEIETGIVAHAFGSSRLRLANTDVLVAVKIEVDVPLPDQPNEGKIEFFVDCSANATPDFEGRGGETLATEIANCLSDSYKSRSALDLHQLCIMKGRKCWKLLVDILVLECGGNLYDAVSIAVKTALRDTEIPKVLAVNLDGDKVEMDVSDNLHDCEKLNVDAIPIMVTVCRIGEEIIVDPSLAEEECSTESVVVAVSKQKFTTILQSGSGSLHCTTLLDCLKLGAEAAKEIDAALDKTFIELDKTTEPIGFLA